MKIAIVGAGAFGSALGFVLQNNGHVVSYYDPFVGYNDLPEAISEASYILIAVPSFFVPDALKELPTAVPLIIASKGILNDKILKPFKDYMVISGPGFADDIKSCKKTLLTTNDSRVIDIFENDYLKFDKTDDRKGVLMCGALKNVYALFAGFLGLERDSDLWRKYIEGSTDEMKKILKANGADPDTVDLSCGRGDLELTCGKPSRNYEFGLRLRDDEAPVPDKTVEGLSAAKAIKAGAIKVPDDAGILQMIFKSILKNDDLVNV